MSAAAAWEFFDGRSADSVIVREIRKARLSKAESAALDRLLESIALGAAVAGRDYKHLKAEGLWEVRFAGDGKRIFRLLYSPEAGPAGKRLVLVGLRFVPKKSDRLARQVFETARSRLRQWHDSQERGIINS